MVDLNKRAIWACKIVKMKIFRPGLLEGRWYTGKKIRQIWAEWAVCISCYLQKPWSKDFHFDNFACPDGLFTQINHCTILYIYFIEIIIAMRGVL